MPHCAHDTLEIYYETHGSPSSPALMLIHGMGSSHKDWDFQIPAFQSKYFVITIDLRGHGQSSKPKGPHTVTDFAGDCIAVLDHLKIQNMNVLGLSLGCFTVLELAIRYPDRLQGCGVIGVNGTASVSLDSWKAKMNGLSRFLTVIFRGTRIMGRNIAKNVFPKPEQAELRQMVEDTIGANTTKNYLATLKGLIGWSVEDELGDISCPVLLISAEYDYSPVEVKQAMVDKIPNARLHVIPDSRHLVNIEKAEEFNGVVLEFLQNIPAN
ncbi:MAG: alpha/beta fold hydrolase [Promethearchaeota archaeon]